MENENKTHLIKQEILDVLKKHEIPALLAADILSVLSRDMVCYFNTKDIQEFYNGMEVVKRIVSESKLGSKDCKIMWDEVVKSNV